MDISFIDFHTHLHQYDINDSSLYQIKEHNILTVAASMDIPSYLKTKEIKEKLNTPLIIPTFGIHPSLANIPFNKNEISKAMNESNIIGEIGLDYLWAKDVSKIVQQEVFRLFLEHCNEKEKYCVIHTKDAEEDVLDILKEYPKAKPIIHWYDGPTSIFKEIIKRGYYCTFGCEVMYSSHVRELLALLPLNRLLLETDNPESEIWLGGKRGDPLLIEEVEERVAKTLNKEKNEIKRIVKENSLRILGF